jgi:hypothetical protein
MSENYEAASEIVPFDLFDIAIAFRFSSSRLCTLGSTIVSELPLTIVSGGFSDCRVFFYALVILLLPVKASLSSFITS